MYKYKLTLGSSSPRAASVHATFDGLAPRASTVISSRRGAGEKEGMKPRNRRLVVRGLMAPAEETAVDDDGRGDGGGEERGRGRGDCGGGGGQGRRRVAMPPLTSPPPSMPRDRRVRICLLVPALVVMRGIYSVLPTTSTADLYDDLPSRLPYGEVGESVPHGR
jgi:hypothetical protein